MESWLERLLFRKVALWVVALLAILGATGMVIFGNIAIHTYKGGTRAGRLGDGILFLSNLPELYRRLTNTDTYLRVKPDPFPGEGGYSFSYGAGTRPDAGYLLLSRYDGDDRRSYVEFWDLNAQEMLHRWAPPIDEINAAAKLVTNDLDLVVDKSLHRMLIRHPAVTAEGDILIKSRTPFTRVSMCNEVIWSNDESVFHHAVEVDDEGYFWVASRIEPTEIAYVNRETFLDDAITRVSPEGEIVDQISVAQILIDNDMDRYVYGRSVYMDNPIHLNDIQPVTRSGPHWQKGDLFLSLRSHSLILLYRPSTNEIVWYREGPWTHQHDVDILDDHRISIFDNNAIKTWAADRVKGHSSILILDFDTGQITSPWDAVLAELSFQTASEGLHRIRENGNLFAEEQNRGRLLELDDDGSVVWTYVNRADDGNVYRVGWSRFLEPEEGAAIAERLRTASCS